MEFTNEERDVLIPCLNTYLRQAISVKDRYIIKNGILYSKRYCGKCHSMKLEHQMVEGKEALLYCKNQTEHISAVKRIIKKINGKKKK